jgi:hypothetical protein
VRVTVANKLSGSEPDFMPKKHALLIANTEYRDGKLSPLAHPGLAYAELADALKDPSRSRPWSIPI